jgi:photosystem II stability/assembly factor-like uncharacterized protein
MSNSFFTSIVIFLFCISIQFQIASAQWVQKSNGMATNQEIDAIAISGNNVFAGIYLGGIYRSTDYGESWVQSGLSNLDVYTIAVNGTYIFAGTEGGGIFRSSNNGTTWTTVNNGLTSLFVNVITINGTNIFAGTVHTSQYGGVYLSTNNGDSWVSIGLTNYYVRTLAANGSNLFAGTAIDGVFLSTNNGLNWTPVNNGLPNNPEVISLLANGGNIYAGNFPGVYITTDNGMNWNTCGLSNQIIDVLVSNGTNILAGSDSGVFLSTNSGGSWLDKNQGFGIVQRVLSLLITDNYVFAGTVLNSVWRRNKAEVIGIQKISQNVPSSFSLAQNFPNPFNPTTKIRYELKKNGFVKLVVFDALGRIVTSLVNENESPGTYEVEWNDINNASGIYFYQLETSNFIDTKKMVVLK